MCILLWYFRSTNNILKAKRFRKTVKCSKWLTRRRHHHCDNTSPYLSPLRRNISFESGYMLIAQCSVPLSKLKYDLFVESMWKFHLTEWWAIVLSLVRWLMCMFYCETLNQRLCPLYHCMMMMMNTLSVEFVEKNTTNPYTLFTLTVYELCIDYARCQSVELIRRVFCFSATSCLCP